MTVARSPESAWPTLTLSEWEDTRDAVHLWTQIVGKVRLALEPMVNHWWQVPFYVSARGLTTSLMHVGHDGPRDRVRLHRPRPRPPDCPTGAGVTVALRAAIGGQFLRGHHGRARTTSGFAVTILARPVEVAEAIPFADDQNASCLRRGRHAPFLARPGPDPPGHGAFRGGSWARPARSISSGGGRPGGDPLLRPPGTETPRRRSQLCRLGQGLAYSHEVSSCGFWPGGSEEGSFYSYAYPEPDGFEAWPIRPGLPTTTSAWASSYFPTRPSDWRRTLTPC